MKGVDKRSLNISFGSTIDVDYEDILISGLGVIGSNNKFIFFNFPKFTKKETTMVAIKLRNL